MIKVALTNKISKACKVKWLKRDTNHFFFLDYFLAFLINIEMYQCFFSLVSSSVIIHFIFILILRDPFVDWMEINFKRIKEIFGVSHCVKWRNAWTHVSSSLLLYKYPILLPNIRVLVKKSFCVPVYLPSTGKDLTNEGLMPVLRLILGT